MPANKYLLSDKSKLLRTKLDRLSQKLQGSLQSDELRTKEEYLFEAIKVLRGFYKTLSEPQTEIPNPKVDSYADFDDYDEVWNQVLNDLLIVFSELENIETLTISNFNFAITEANRLTTRLKAVSSKLGDYILYSLNANKDALFFKDSFNDLSKVDIGTSLLNEKECEVNQDEGIVTLPLNRDVDPTVLITATPIINPNSNGANGNNQEVGASYNGNINVVLDNNPDTWFEYERVTTTVSDTTEELVLDVTVNLGEPTIVNRVRVNPNNFGTKTIIQIDAIDTSLDGRVYTSIKDDIPIAGFTTEDEENIFTLAPSTSKYAGQGIYSFTPRKVKYIHFTFRQPEPYIITTPAGERLRYAIGIRDIEILGLNYLDIGELVSVPFETTEEIRRIILQANQNPSELSDLVAIDYSVSPDDGQTWYDIRPKELEGIGGLVGVPEILEFNGASTDTIETSVPVKSLRLKMKLSRDDEKFLEGSSYATKHVDTRTEVHNIPAGSPFQFTLERPPVDGSVVVVDPLYGSRGLSGFPYIVGHAYDRMDLQTYRLPLKLLPRPVEKAFDGTKYYLRSVPVDEWMHVEVGGEEWTHATDALSTYSSSDKVYSFNPNNGTLRFGNGTTGKKPAENAPIAVWFEDERIFPSVTENSHVAKLEFPTSSNKNDFDIIRYGQETQHTQKLRRKATVVQLDHDNISDYSELSESAFLDSGDRQDFLNGYEELTASGHWSIDPDNGLLYMFTPTPDNQDVTVSYRYVPRYTLQESEWDWAKSDMLRDSVAIKESAWQTLPMDFEEVFLASGVNVFDLSKMHLVQGSISIELTDSGDAVDSDLTPFLKEVPFVDGSTELGTSVTKTTEGLEDHDGSGLKVYSLSESVTSNEDYVVAFSNSGLFQAVDTTPNNEGEYYVNRATGQVLVFSNIAQKAGTVTYYYDNPSYNDNGLFSIDYENGRIFTQRSILSAGWRLLVSYQYTDYRARYKIARLLDPDDYVVDITNSTVTITDREYMNQLMIPKSGLHGKSSFYLVNYEYVKETREDIQSLRDYFTPVIKDYMLKVLTKDRIL